MQQLGCILRELYWVDKPKSYILYDSVYITFLEWYNYRNGEEISGYEGFKEEGSGLGYKRARQRVFVVMEMFYILTASMSVSWLWYCTLVLQDVAIGGNWVLQSLCIICYNLRISMYVYTHIYTHMYVCVCVCVYIHIVIYCFQIIYYKLGNG